MKYRILALVPMLAIVLTASACVSKSNYNTLLADYAELARHYDELNQQSLDVGAQLQAAQAEADMRRAKAEAEKRRAMAVAREQEMKAQVVENEAKVPLAMAEAFKQGNLGIMDYYRMKNISADTSMRESIAKPPKQQE